MGGWILNHWTPGSLLAWSVETGDRERLEEGAQRSRVASGQEALWKSTGMPPKAEVDAVRFLTLHA